MGTREDGVKKDPAAAAAGDGGLSGARPVGQAGVDFSGQGTVGPGGVELRPRDLFGLGGGGATGFASGSGPGPGAPAGRRGDPHGPERDPLGVIAREARVPADFRGAAAAGDRGGTMTRRHLALLFLLLGATTLAAGEPDAPWLSQFGALLAWLAGCILLFLSLQ